MDEKMLRKRIGQIKENSVRTEIMEIYEEMILKFNRYQEQELAKIRTQVRESLKKENSSCAVAMLVCRQAESKQYDEFYEPLLSTGMVRKDWGTGTLETVFLEADREFIEKRTGKGHLYRALVKTNYESYHITVTLQKNREAAKRAEHLNRLFVQNAADQPPVNEAYLNKFYDVVFEETKDRLRPDEIVLKTELSLMELDPYLRRERVLLWNVRQVQIKESTFPVPVGTEIRYRHELFLPHAGNSYLLDASAANFFQTYRKGNTLWITTAERRYQTWNLYEVMQDDSNRTKENEICLMTNQRKESALTDMQQGGRVLYTWGELYRRAAGYQAAELFRKIEVRQHDSWEQVKIVFFPKKEGYYLNRDAMQYIVDALSLDYRGCRITGRLEEYDA